MKRTILSLVALLGITLATHAQSVVTFYTTMGDFEIELYDTLKPITAGNFIDLTNAEFYDNVIFHRIIEDFVIQGGDPTGTGFGGPGYTIEDEFDPSLSNIQKTISMANSGPNTGGSQFFINMVDNTYLDFDNPPFTSAHPVFGTVVSGWDIVLDIQSVPVDGNDRPITPVVMDSIRVTEPFLAVTDFEKDASAAIVYPNPITERSVVAFKNETVDVAHVSIVSLNGILVSNQIVELNQGVNRLKLSNFGVDDLSSGMYFITIDNGKTSVQKRFVKK